MNPGYDTKPKEQIINIKLGMLTNTLHKLMKLSEDYQIISVVVIRTLINLINIKAITNTTKVSNYR